jgi:hypothetical protein
VLGEQGEPGGGGGIGRAVHVYITILCTEQISNGYNVNKIMWLAL